jgi:hypothetical protein
MSSPMDFGFFFCIIIAMNRAWSHVRCRVSGMSIMQSCVPKRSRILKGFGKEQDLCPKTCSCIGVEFRKRKYMFIEYNISGDINASF